MKKYSAEWVRAEAQTKGASYVDHHRCGLCDHMVYFSIRGDIVLFHPACDCGWSNPEPRSFEDIARWLAMQSSDEIRDKIMEGLHS